MHYNLSDSWGRYLLDAFARIWHLLATCKHTGPWPASDVFYRSKQLTTETGIKLAPEAIWRPITVQL